MTLLRCQHVYLINSLVSLVVDVMSNQVYHLFTVKQKSLIPWHFLVGIQRCLATQPTHNEYCTKNQEISTYFAVHNISVLHKRTEHKKGIPNS